MCLRPSHLPRELPASLGWSAALQNSIFSNPWHSFSMSPGLPRHSLTVSHNGESLGQALPPRSQRWGCEHVHCSHGVSLHMGGGAGCFSLAFSSHADPLHLSSEPLFGYSSMWTGQGLCQAPYCRPQSPLKQACPSVSLAPLHSLDFSLLLSFGLGFKTGFLSV